MKVLMLSKACYVAAYRRKLEELASLPEIDLTLVVPPYWRMGGRRDYLEQGNQEGYRVIVENPVLNGYHHLHFYRRLPAILAQVRPDVLHIDEEPYDFVAFNSLRAAGNLGIKTVFFTWQNIFRGFPFPFNHFERYTLGHCDAGIAGNEDAAQVLRRKGFTGPIEVIPQFGVDPEVFQPRDGESKERRSSVEIGYVGRIVEEKGISILLDAVAQIEGDWRLQLVGTGPFEAVVREKAAALGIVGKLSFVPKMPSTEIPQFLPQLDILVLPSLTTSGWKEQFGRVLIEAMACGVPVVGSDSGEIPYVIGEAGLVAKEGDPWALKTQLEMLMANPDLRRKLSLLGRQRVMDNFTQRKVAEKTFALYRQIMRLQGVV